MAGIVSLPNDRLWKAASWVFRYLREEALKVPGASHLVAKRLVSDAAQHNDFIDLEDASRQDLVAFLVVVSEVRDSVHDRRIGGSTDPDAERALQLRISDLVTMLEESLA
jgi:predicted HD phosphohydrolase